MGKGAGFCYPVERGIECGSTGTSPHAKFGRSPEAFEGLFFSSPLKTVLRLDVVFL